VILPALQANLYDLSFLDGGIMETVSLMPDTLFAFPTGGVDAFSVNGIDRLLALNPLDTTSFVTGLTFVSDGMLSGTQTPITIASTPEPATLALLVFGLVGVAGMPGRRERRRGMAGLA
jgi:hypothetical protein